MASELCRRKGAYRPCWSSMRHFRWQSNPLANLPFGCVRPFGGWRSWCHTDRCRCSSWQPWWYRYWHRKPWYLLRWTKESWISSPFHLGALPWFRRSSDCRGTNLPYPMNPSFPVPPRKPTSFRLRWTYKKKRSWWYLPWRWVHSSRAIAWHPSWEQASFHLPSYRHPSCLSWRPPFPWQELLRKPRTSTIFRQHCATCSWQSFPHYLFSSRW